MFKRIIDLKLEILTKYNNAGMRLAPISGEASLILGGVFSADLRWNRVIRD
jgi:hypothetical protein